MATLIKQDGTKKEVEPNNGSDFQLKEMYELIGCSMIQIIEIGDQIMVIDEEGKFEPTPHKNEKATELASNYLFAGDYIAGDALVCESGEVK